MKSRNWLATVQADESKMEHITWLMPGADCPFRHWMDYTKVVYICCQVEKAPETGKIHAHVYVQLNMNARLSTVKNKLNKEAHWETRRGTHEQARAYHTKDESRVAGPWEIGMPVNEQGKRNDIKDLYEDVKAKKSTLEILESTGGAAARYEKALKFMRFTTSEQESDRELQGVRVITLYGSTGVGKTYAAINLIAGSKDYYIAEAPSHKDSKLWFDGYEGQKTLILDDFDGSYCGYRYILRLLDIYRLKVEVKGGFAWAVWTTVVITSNSHPNGWYTMVNQAPLQRRLTEKGSEIRLIENQGVYKRMDWNEVPIDEDFISFPVVVPAAPVILAPDTPVVPTAVVQGNGPDTQMDYQDSEDDLNFTLIDE